MTQTFFDDGDFNKLYTLNVKKCTVCKQVKTLDNFHRSKKQPDGRHYTCKECNKKYREQHKEQIAEHDRKYYSENKTKYAEHHKIYKVERHGVIVEGRRRYYQRIKVKHYQYTKDYRKTPNGQKIQRLAYARRKKYGFAPLNEPFDGAEFHHLHRDLDGNVDHSIGIYIPSEIHQRLYHNHKTWQGMDEMNKLAIEWYFSTGENDVSIYISNK